MFEIIGGDGKTYGPVTSDELRRWVREGRADSGTKVKRGGEADWVPLGSLDEFFPEVVNHPPLLRAVQGMKDLRIGHPIRMGECFGRAWAAYRQDPWKITGVIILVLLLQFLMNSIPVVGAFLAFLLNGPILGGLYFFCHQALRGKLGGVAEVISIVRERFCHVFWRPRFRACWLLGPFCWA